MNQTRFLQGYLAEGSLLFLLLLLAGVAGGPQVQAQSITTAPDGTGTIVTPNANQFDISGGTLSGDGANLFQSFQQFGLDANQIANFLANPQIQNILGRVVGGDPSIINGLIQVTGGNANLYLMNPAGIVFGPNASLNVPAAFTATTATSIGFGNAWLNAYGPNSYAQLVGNPDAFAFAASQPGSIINVGQLIAAPEQSITLMGGAVINTGTIATPGGKITIAAIPGEQLVRITQDGNLLSLDLPIASSSGLPSQPLSPLDLPKLLTGGNQATMQTFTPGLSATAGTLINSGRVDASRGNQPGGIVNLQAQVSLQYGTVTASGTQGGTVQIGGDRLLNAGVIQADGFAGNGGTIAVQLTGRAIQTASGLISATGGRNGSGGTILVQGGNTAQTATGAVGGVFLSGKLDASAVNPGQRGGQVSVLGYQLDLYDAQIDVRGDGGGGTILVGGDFQGKNPLVPNASQTTVNAASQFLADALTIGNGGQVIIWSDQQTNFSGAVMARGGVTAGNGGFVEVSGKENLAMGGSVDTAAVNGKNGTLLLDPKNILISNTVGVFPQFDLVDPNTGGGTGFGSQIVPLTTGNVVVTKPGDNLTAANAGAVYLYNGLTGGLISVLSGTTANDQVGVGGITTLTNGNYVISSFSWNNGAAINAGAATWGNGSTGITGNVSAANSLVGTTANDSVGRGVTALTNGNYVVNSPLWNNGAATQAGAVTWGNGSTGITGNVSAANSLVGTTTNDQVGLGRVIVLTVLTNGNYVVNSPFWNNGAATQAGAVTWGNGSTGITGNVSAANSLVGTTANDRVGFEGVTALTNGNYVVSSPFWNNGAATEAGAATWGNGSTGITGNVSAANSLVGTTANDQVGFGGVTALTNSNYVVNSYNWNNGAATEAGAVTWGNGNTGITGNVSAANSLVGTTANDQVGSGFVTALTNGNYVVNSYNWNNGPATGVGAVTWGNGSTGITGNVSAANSLVGTTANDQVGFGGVTALTNGNYVVNSYNWNNGAATEAGAVTWGNGSTGITGNVSAANSLVGTTANDFVGRGLVTALTNGNYVVSSFFWNNGAATQAGAVTWGNGNTGIIGHVSAANSLVGTTAYDFVGFEGVTPLTNGNYVVSSSFWNNGAATVTGAVTWGNGSTGITGHVSAADSLVGTTANDEVGNGGITALTNGNYVVSSSSWNNGAATRAGAVTWGNGSTGQTLTGSNQITAQNSIIGRVANAGMGFAREDKVNGSFLVSFANDPTSGRVTVGLTNPNQLTFNRGQGASLAITTDFLTQTLNTGTAVVLQASNDILLDTPLITNNPAGNGGSLTLQAGRSIFINANITTDNGNLTLIANDTLASGVVNAFRDPGAAGLVIASGVTLNTGTGNATLILGTGAGLTNNTSGPIATGSILAGNIQIANNGPNQQGISTNSQSLTATPGGTISLSSVGPIQTGNLVASNQNGSGGTITLNSAGAIATGSINAQGSQPGGSIDITTGNFFRSTGSLVALNNITASLTTNGGPITIRHSGNGITPFVVGDASLNGTIAAITTGGGNTIFPSQSYLFTYIQGTAPAQIQIISVPPPLAPPLQPTPLPPSFPFQIPPQLQPDPFLPAGSAQFQLQSNSGLTLSVTVQPQFPPSQAPRSPGLGLIVTSASTLQDIVSLSQALNLDPLAPALRLPQLLLPQPGGTLVVSKNHLLNTINTQPDIDFILANSFQRFLGVDAPVLAARLQAALPDDATTTAILQRQQAFSQQDPTTVYQTFKQNLLTELASSGDIAFGNLTDFVQTIQVGPRDINLSLALNLNLDNLDQSVSDVEALRAREFAREFNRKTSDQAIAADNIREMLQNIVQLTGKHPAVIYTVSLPDRLELLLVTPTGKTFRRTVPVSQLFLRQVATEFTNTVSDNRSTNYLILGRQLYRWLIQPLEAELKKQDIDVLLFSLDPGTRAIPLAALYDGQQYLVEKYSLSLIPSVNLTDVQYQGLGNAQVLAMGASEFSDNLPLPSVPTELALVTAKPWTGKTFLNQQFTLDNLKAQRRIRAYEIVHLATHAEFTANASYIQLWDTKLKPEQLQQLGLQSAPVELLVLSACRTARGDEKAELGFAGLAFQSGAKSVAASLWYVSDEGTLALMYGFYDRLKTEPIKADALQKAQVALIHGQITLRGNRLEGLPNRTVELPGAFENPNLSHPYYWAGFTMVGSPW